jgi:hypothetical protein
MAPASFPAGQRLALALALFVFRLACLRAADAVAAGR